jgi:hypothetical protein
MFEMNPAVRAFENMRILASVSAVEMRSLPQRFYAAPDHYHSFTKAFGLPERRLGAWLEQGAVELELKAPPLRRGCREYYMRLVAALTDWRKLATPARVALNGRPLFAGNLFVENVCRGWPAMYYRVPEDVLAAGANALRIERTDSEPGQTLVLERVELIAFDTGAPFNVVAAPTLANIGEPFLVAVKTPDIANTRAILPEGWKQLGKPVALLGEENLHGFRLAASRPGANVPVRFRLGRSQAAAMVRLVSAIPGEPRRVLVGLQGDDIRHDNSAEMPIVLKSLLLGDMGNWFCFRPQYGRNFFELADAAEVDRWIGLVAAAQGVYSTCIHNVAFGTGAFSESSKRFERAKDPAYVGRMSHEPYLMVQKQWQTPQFRRARDVELAARAYRQHIQSFAAPDGRTSIGEPSYLGMYLRGCGFDYIFCEPVANFTLLTAAARGVCRDTSTAFGYHLAPDWYFGWPNDARKNRRLECALYGGYIAGGNAFYLENSAFGTNANTRMYMDEPFIRRNREIMREFYAIARLHPRPGEPERRFAAVFGHCNSAIWLHDDVIPELLDTRHSGGSGEKTSSNWTEPVWGKWPDNGSRACMRAVDAVAPPVPFKADRRSVLKMFTGTPFGQFDMVQTDFETLDKYALLFYTGFNLMTGKHLLRLEEYVRNGGTLLLASAHLNATKVPTRPITWRLDAAMRRLVGAELASSSRREAMRKRGAEVAVLPVKRLAGAEVLETTAQGTPLVLTNALGRGRVVILNAADYVSLGAALPVYRRLIREHVNALPMDFGIRGADRVVCGVYRRRETTVMQMFHTGWDDAGRELDFQVVLWGEPHDFTLKPCAFAEIVASPKAAFWADSPFAKVEICGDKGDTTVLSVTSAYSTRVHCIGRYGQARSVHDAHSRPCSMQRGSFRVPEGSGDIYKVRFNFPLK